MKKIGGYVLMLVGGLILALAFFVWISSDYPDFSPFHFLGQFENGLWSLVETQALWLRVVIIALPGLIIFNVGKSLTRSREEN